MNNKVEETPVKPAFPGFPGHQLGGAPTMAEWGLAPAAKRNKLK